MAPIVAKKPVIPTLKPKADETVSTELGYNKAKIRTGLLPTESHRKYYNVVNKSFIDKKVVVFVTCNACNNV